jgi:hypothetical protein
MKKLIVSAGLVAAGVASVDSVFGDGLDIISPKSWSVSGNLRGFYDDNYNIAPGKKGSFGAEVSPSISYNLPTQQSDMGIRYTYGLYYYQDRQDLGLDPFDQTHQADLWLDHAFNERWHLNFTDTFGSGQEPELISGPNAANPGAGGTLFRVNGNNIGNHAKVSLDTQWTPLFGTSLHYGNDFYDYDNHGSSVSTNGVIVNPLLPTMPPGTGVPNAVNGYQILNSPGASLAGLLNRVDQNVGLDFNWTLSSTTKIIAGVSVDLTTYTGGEAIDVFNFNVNPTGTNALARSLVYKSDARNSVSPSVYVGLNSQLTQNLSLQGTVGALYTDSYNDPLNATTSWSPTANISLTYTYNSGSYAQLGVSQGVNSTYISQISANGSLTQYQYSTSVYAAINQRIFEKFMASLIGRYVYSTYQGGAFSSEADNYFGLGVNLSYQISRHFSAEIGYNYDDLQSNIPGNGYNRNRAYIGLGANY